jgi:cytochrome c
LVAVLAAACGGKSKPAPMMPDGEKTTTEPPPTEAVARTETPPPAETKPADDSIAQQTALTEQYELGKKVYTEKKCASCHGDHGEGNPKNPPVMGEKALPEAAPKKAKLRKGVAFKTAADVEAFVKAKMPIKAPGTLSDDEAFAVAAWMLSENKVAIDKKVDASNAASINLR